MQKVMECKRCKTKTLMTETYQKVKIISDRRTTISMMKVYSCTQCGKVSLPIYKF